MAMVTADGRNSAREVSHLDVGVAVLMRAVDRRSRLHRWICERRVDAGASLVEDVVAVLAHDKAVVRKELLVGVDGGASDPVAAVDEDEPGTGRVADERVVVTPELQLRFVLRTGGGSDDTDVSFCGVDQFPPTGLLAPYASI